MFSKTNLPGDSSKFDADSAKRMAAIKNMALKVTKIHCFGCTDEDFLGLQAECSDHGFVDGIFNQTLHRGGRGGERRFSSKLFTVE